MASAFTNLEPTRELLIASSVFFFLGTSPAQKADHPRQVHNRKRVQLPWSFPNRPLSALLKRAEGYDRGVIRGH